MTISSSLPPVPMQTEREEKKFPFESLPKELQYAVGDFLDDREKRNLASTNKTQRAMFKKWMAAKKAIGEIRATKVTSIGDFSKALAEAQGVGAGLTDEAMRWVAEKLIYLPRDEAEEGEKMFKQAAGHFIRDGNAIDQAIKFFLCARSIPTGDVRDLRAEDVEGVKRKFELEMRRGFSAEQALKQGISIFNGINSHNTLEIVQHAREIELNGLPNLSVADIGLYASTMQMYMHSGVSARQAFESARNECGKVNSHDENRIMQLVQNSRR